ncbi:putative quinol monooxygenase [Enterobacter ludwigii]|uniref:putative quinol monooxygenase n=1 Tax=Enterobacter ludwigii TaxID=299767 RepID=UPI003BEF056F
MNHIHCVARFLAKSGKIDELVESLRKLIPDTLSEDGCIGYDLTREIQYPGSHGEKWDVCLIEQWKSREDFELHCAKPYITHFFESTAKILVEKSDVRLYGTSV